MKNKKINSIIFRIIFSLVGLFSLLKIIKKYGFTNLVEEVNQTGFLLVLLALTFIPTLICYAVSWMLASDHQRMFQESSIFKKISIFTKITVVSIAWNNLTPFLKVGGEPLKYLMLSKYLPKSDALASTINYNIIHLLATGVSFVVTSIVLVLFYQMPNEVRYYLLGFAFVFSISLYLLIWILRVKFVYIAFTFRYRILRVIIVNIKVAFRRLLKFYNKSPGIFCSSLIIDIIARFIEGLTFYFGFYLIKHQISFLSSSLLDVGRTFVDNIFFFVPYQIGTREEGVRFFMEKILFVDSKGFLSAVFLYRFVEITWIFIGYIIWVSTKSSSKELSV
ncbi:MAG: flippase-like domain-containing protein [Bacteriovorax sp.]|nr:flippase-like domain-containing protein [Bacteriovorax sp.]